VANSDGGRALAEKVREVICEEWDGVGGSLESTVVYRLLLERAERYQGVYTNLGLSVTAHSARTVTAPWS
jgi:hypothetical protein